MQNKAKCLKRGEWGGKSAGLGESVVHADQLDGGGGVGTGQKKSRAEFAFEFSAFAAWKILQLDTEEKGKSNKLPGELLAVMIGHLLVMAHKTTSLI